MPSFAGTETEGENRTQDTQGGGIWCGKAKGPSTAKVGRTVVVMIVRVVVCHVCEGVGREVCMLVVRPLLVDVGSKVRRVKSKSPMFFFFPFLPRKSPSLLVTHLYLTFHTVYLHDVRSTCACVHVRFTVLYYPRRLPVTTARRNKKVPVPVPVASAQCACCFSLSASIAYGLPSPVAPGIPKQRIHTTPPIQQIKRRPVHFHIS